MTLRNRFCSLTTSFEVSKLPMPIVDLGPDTSICEGEPITLDAGDDGEDYLWNTGDTAQEISVFREGWYSVVITRNNCSNADSVWVGPICDMWYFIPNAFTPGDDVHNDVFSVNGQYLKQVDMQIYNRWGQLIYSDSGRNPSWNGTHNAAPCPDGVYLYRISVKGYKNGRLLKEYRHGTVTLLR